MSELLESIQAYEDGIYTQGEMVQYVIRLLIDADLDVVWEQIPQWVRDEIILYAECSVSLEAGQESFLVSSEERTLENMINKSLGRMWRWLSK